MYLGKSRLPADWRRLVDVLHGRLVGSLGKLRAEGVVEVGELHWVTGAPFVPHDEVPSVLTFTLSGTSNFTE